MTKTKTIAVTEDVWERLTQIMKKEGAKSMNDILARLIERGVAPRSRFGVLRKRGIRFTQEEHEEITSELH